MFKRGDIYYIEYGKTMLENNGAEKQARPAIIVSNNKNNTYSSVVEVVYLTTQPKNDLPTHCDIYSSGKKATALCEQIHSISVERIGTFIGECTEQEMSMIDIALAISLGLSFKETDRAEPTEPVPDENNDAEAVREATKLSEGERLSAELLKTETERDLYKTMYEQVLDRLIPAK